MGSRLAISRQISITPEFSKLALTQPACVRLEGQECLHYNILRRRPGARQRRSKAESRPKNGLEPLYRIQHPHTLTILRLIFLKLQENLCLVPALTSLP